jgi:hypothetical protein
MKYFNKKYHLQIVKYWYTWKTLKALIIMVKIDKKGTCILQKKVWFRPKFLQSYDLSNSKVNVSKEMYIKRWLLNLLLKILAVRE